MEHYDSIIIGAGFSGIYQLYSLREKLKFKKKYMKNGYGQKDIQIKK